MSCRAANSSARWQREFPLNKILFSGVGKTADELQLALSHDILCINVESEPELEALSRSRAMMGAPRASRCASIRMSIPGRTRRSPPASRKTNSVFRSRGRARSMRARRNCRAFAVAGVDMHIGSQITDLGPMEAAFRLLAEFVTRAARRRPHDFACRFRRRSRRALCTRTALRRPSPSPMRRWSSAVTHNLGCTLMFEPGRMIVGNAGILVSRVIYVKHGDAKQFRHHRRRDERSDPPDAL
jgi:diaminopimelate decarboxylase